MKRKLLQEIGRFDESGEKLQRSTIQGKRKLVLEIGISKENVVLHRQASTS